MKQKKVYVVSALTWLMSLVILYFMMVLLQVIDLQTVSDEMGNFRLSVPLDKQQVQQRVQAFKKGYELWDFTGPVSDKIPWKIILRK